MLHAYRQQEAHFQRLAAAGDLDTLRATPRRDLEAFGHPIMEAAARGGHVQLVEWLVAQGEVVSGGWTRLHLAAYTDDLAPLQAAVEAEDVEWSKLYHSYHLPAAAVMGDAINVMQWLVKQHHWPVDVPIYHRYGPVPLMMALEVKKMDMVRCLIELGANVKSMYVLKAAVEHCPEALPVLVQAGADVCVRSALPQSSLLHCAAAKGRVEVLDTLLEMGVDLHAVDGEGCLAIHEAARVGAGEAIHRLVERGVDVNARDRQGRTVVHHLVRNSSEYVGVLKHVVVQLGADVNARANNGQTALHIAAHRGAVSVMLGTAVVSSSNITIVRAFLELGADRQVSDDRGRTPRDMASPQDRAVLDTYFPITAAVSQLLLGVGGHAEEDSALARLAAHPTFDANVLSIIKCFYSGGTTPAVAQLLREAGHVASNSNH